MRQVDFEKFIPVPSYKNIYFDQNVDFRKSIPVSGYKDIYFDKVC